MHPSIIKSEDLYNELKLLEKRVGSKQMPVSAKLENMFLLEKLIDIECYIFNNKITYLLHFPISHDENFELFHLYSAPSYTQSRFKVILPRSKFLVKSKLHYAYQDQGCQEASPQMYLCSNKNLKEVNTNSPCTVHLLSSTKNTSTCLQVELISKQPIINQLSTSNNWLFFIPSEEIVKLKCFTQVEERKLFGTFLFEIPNGCQVSIHDFVIVSEQKQVNNTVQPILFPDLGDTPSLLPLLNLNFHLNNLKLDGLQELKSQIVANKVQLSTAEIPTVPSVWTIAEYVLLFIGCSYLITRKLVPICCHHKKPEAAKSEQPLRQPIQLP